MLEPEEALEGKKDILTAKADILELMQIIQNYNSLRAEELKLKAKLYTKIKTLKNKMQRLKITLPKIKINELPHYEEYTELPNSTKLRTQLKSKQTNNSIDRELEEIQRKLRELSR